ncbi:MAG TPA: hypothetical protein VNI57_13550, partial [Candidatus Saccharimonadales bacterium]|nr:hypothetical protein [Candidatus Saccharimonadales bacterium]
MSTSTCGALRSPLPTVFTGGDVVIRPASFRPPDQKARGICASRRIFATVGIIPAGPAPRGADAPCFLIRWTE